MPMTLRMDAKMADVLDGFASTGKDVENPSEGRRRAARSVAERLAAEFDDAA